MSRHRRRRHGSGTERPPPKSLAAAALAGALCVLAAVPYGSAGGWARSAVAFACVLVSGLICLLTAERAGASTERGGGRPAAAVLIWLMFALAVAQFVPLPTTALARLQPLALPAHREILSGMSWAPISIEPFRSLCGLSLWTGYALLAWSCARLSRSRRAANALFLFIAAAGTIQALIGIFVRSDSLPWARETVFGRLAGTFASGSPFGAYLLLTGIATLGAILANAPRIIEDSRGHSARIVLPEALQSGRTFLVLCLALACVIQFAALALSGARAPVMAAAAGAALLLGWFYVTTRGGARGRTVRAFAVILAVVVALGTGGGYSVLAARFGRLMPGAESDYAPRLLIWRAAATLLAQHPLGVGLNCFPVAITRCQPPELGDLRLDHAHNDYLELACELGLPGLLALLCLLALLYRRTRGLRRARAHGFSIWAWRAALVAVAAGLLCAAVDLHFSARPGVAVLWFVLLGATLGYRPESQARPSSAHTVLAVPPPITAAHIGPPQPARAAARPSFAASEATPPIGDSAAGEDSVPPARVERGPRQTALTRQGVLACLVGAAALAQALRAGTAAWLAETAHRSMGGMSDAYFWLNPRPMAFDAAVARLRTAVRLAPDWSWGRALLASAGPARVDAEKTRLREQASASGGRTSRALIDLALRADEVAAEKRAVPGYTDALARSPWSADLHAVLCRSLFVATEWEPEADAQARARARAHASLAVALAPNDVGVGTRVCAALARATGAAVSEAERNGLADALKRIGAHVLGLGDPRDGGVLRAWHAAGFHLPTVLAETGQPAPVLWEAYRLYDARNESAEALQCIEAVGRAAAGGAPGSADFVSLATRERCKWLLRLGREPEYRDLLNERRAVLAAALEQRTRDVKRSLRSADVLYLKLRDLEQSMGLNAALYAELCQIELDQRRPEQALDMMAELSLRELPGGVPALSAMLDSPDKLPSRGAGLRLAQAAVSLNSGLPEAARDVLASVLESRGLPRRFAHRVCLNLWRAHEALGETEAGREVLVRALSYCADDPDVLQALVAAGYAQRNVALPNGQGITVQDRLAELTPDRLVGARFLGEKVEYVGLSADPISRAVGGNLLCRLHWRFWGAVAPDLEAVIQIRDDGASAALSRRVAFARAQPADFASGFPAIGGVLVVEFRIPLWATDARLCAVGLQRQTGKGWLPTIEGLTTVETPGWLGTPTPPTPATDAAKPE